MKLPLSVALAVGLSLVAVPARADPAPVIVPLGHDTYALTREAGTGFTRDTDKLKAQALEDAAAYCAKQHKELKVISTEAHHPLVPLTGFARAKVVFKALDADDPELHAPAASASGVITPAASEPAAAPSATDALYRDLTRLGELRKQGLLTDEEFQTLKKKLLEKYQ